MQCYQHFAKTKQSVGNIAYRVRREQRDRAQFQSNVNDWVQKEGVGEVKEEVVIDKSLGIGGKPSYRRRIKPGYKKFSTMISKNTNIKTTFGGGYNKNSGIQNSIAPYRNANIEGKTANRIAKSAGGNPFGIISNLKRIK